MAEKKKRKRSVAQLERVHANFAGVDVGSTVEVQWADPVKGCIDGEIP